MAGRRSSAATAVQRHVRTEPTAESDASAQPSAKPTRPSESVERTTEPAKSSNAAAADAAIRREQSTEYAIQR